MLKTYNSHKANQQQQRNSNTPLNSAYETTPQSKTFTIQHLLGNWALIFNTSYNKGKNKNTKFANRSTKTKNTMTENIKKALFTTVLATLSSLGFAQNVQTDCCHGRFHNDEHCEYAEQPYDSCRYSTSTCNDVSPSTLIIYHDGNNKKLLKAAKKVNAQVLYTYKNINAIAIRKPDNWTLTQTKAYFENIKGVLQVNYDRMMHLQTVAQ